LAINITATGSTNICAKDTVTLQIDSAETGFEYQWVKDNKEIASATGSSLNITGIDAQGVYRLEVNDTKDIVSRCTSPSNDITITLRNPTIKITSPLKIVSIPGTQNTLSVTVTGGNPRTITWFRNGTEIENSNTESFVASLPGTYTAQISATSPCDINTVTANEKVVISPIDNLSLKIDYGNASEYVDCDFSEIRLQILEIASIVDGDKIIVPSSNFGLLDIAWKRNGVELGDFNGPSILIDNAFLNGSYQAEIKIDAFTSNPLSNTKQVKLNFGNLQIQTTANNLNEGETATLEVELPNEVSEPSITYKWFKNNVVREKEISKQITVSEPGKYSAEVTFEGCTANIEPFTLSTVSKVIPNIITPNGFNNTKWKLPIEFSGQEDISVQIISSSGEEVLNQNNYTGDWPNDNLKESIYYYIISKNNNPLEKGTITIIR